MYSAPAVTPVLAGAAPKKALFYSVAGILCICISLFLIIATIVVALIPIYISDRSTSVDQSPSSKDVTIVIPIDRISSRRRRQSDELDSYIGSEAGPSLKGQVKNILKSRMDSTLIADVNVTQMTLAYKDDGQRKRRSLTKRATRIRVLYMKCVFVYQIGKSLKEKLAAAENIRSRIDTTFSTNFTLRNIDFYRGGVLQVLITAIQLYRPTFIGLIVPETSSVTVGSSPTTGRPTLTTTVNTTTAPVTTPIPVPFIITPPIPG